ncbi:MULTISPECIES: hypothetical protein [Dehalococcoides]|uniref:Uncharacterized protein n=1 Tax=Dehalococcoides mccartyi TaxID=61435 RepID=A0AB38ZAI2_9CHLR|nr:hypothetical protein [Dehalococcoides mccartyi]OBW61804.1 MAG: hypothetical protein A9181_02125 [Dehalococcoides mccartyi]WRO07492.1 hypothetical protein VLL09_00930 [Dehalococcoides mccartyi]
MPVSPDEYLAGRAAENLVKQQHTKLMRGAIIRACLSPRVILTFGLILIISLGGFFLFGKLLGLFAD